MGYEFGYEATHNSYRLTNIKALIMGEPTESTRLEDLLARFNRGLSAPVTKDQLLQAYLGYLRKHLIDQCTKLRLPVPEIVVATHPVAWSAEAVIFFSKLLADAGWGRVETLTAPEAAADAVLRGMPDVYFEERGTSICVVDLGGMTHVGLRINREKEYLLTVQGPSVLSCAQNQQSYHQRRIDEVRGRLWRYGVGRPNRPRPD